MTRKKQSKPWIDPRNIRPADWHPPQMTEKSYSRLLDSFEGVQKQLVISTHLSTLYGVARIAYQCHLFYTDNLSPSILVGYYWSPWNSYGEVSTIIRALLQYVEPDAQDFCRIWLTQMQVLDELNQKWANALAKFLNQAVPKNEEEFQTLRNAVELYRKENGATWAQLPEFQPLVSDLELTVSKMQQLAPEVEELVQKMSAQFSPQDFQAFVEDQEIPDQIEATRDEPSHKRAINKLNRILKDSPSQNQSSQIYLELGFRYAELGEIEQAIENYSKSIDLAKLPNALVYFWRGELYYREKEWNKAVRDFEQAIELEIYTPEREQALQYIAQLQSK
jgi:tetratricopeptide (TPR) repeat protein